LSDAAAPVLQLNDIRLPSRDRREDLTLHAGDLVLVRPGDAQQEQALADVVCGLLPPERGTVRFLGRAWSELPADQANALRGRIGHAARRGAWIPYLSLLDNILLAQLHHTRRPYFEVRAEAVRLANWFGLPGLPTWRPGDLPVAVLKRAAFVRAFLGAPSLIIIESVAGGLGNGLLPPLVNAMRVARDRDAAVLWFSEDAELLADQTLPVTRRLRLRGDATLPLEGAA
jgi:phospholipid/cholesterol/gamma-HCH transport system ATP-binding protein